MPRDLYPELQADFPPVRSARQIVAAAEAAALVSSAVSQDDQPSLAAADRVRQLHPILPHRSQAPHDAPGHAATALAGASHRHHILQASEQ